MLSQRARDILEARGLDTERLVTQGWESIAPVGGCESIKIPFVRRGEVVNHKYRLIEGEKRFWQDPGAPKVFYNRDILDDPTLKGYPVIITEGEPDCEIARLSGFPKVVSVPDGAPATRIDDPESTKYSFLLDSDYLKGETEIILATDGDPAGRNLMLDLAVRLGRARCKWIEYPDGTKDLNEVYLVSGETGVRAVLESAKWFHIEGAGTLSEFAPVPDQVCYRTGFDFLDTHYKIRLGDFVVITGIPGHGKTTFVNDLACRMAEIYNWTICHASFEQSVRPDHEEFLRSWWMGKPVEQATEEELRDADRWIEERFTFVAPVESVAEGTKFDLDWVLESIAAMVIRHGVKMAIVDPWNEIEHERPSGMTETQYIGWAIRTIKRFAKKYNIHFVVVAHPYKLAQGKEGALPVPTLYDISDSAHWANKADVGIVIYRHREGMTQAKIEKVRFQKKIGLPGSQYMRLNTWKNRFEASPGPGEI